MTKLEELAFAHGKFSERIVRYLDMLRSSHRSASAATAGTTGLLVLISGAAHGRNLPSTVQATDSNVRDSKAELARMAREALARAKGKPGLWCPGQLPSITPRHRFEVRRPRCCGTLGGLCRVPRSYVHW